MKTEPSRNRCDRGFGNFEPLFGNFAGHDPFCCPPKDELELKDRTAGLSAYSPSLR